MVTTFFGSNTGAVGFSSLLMDLSLSGIACLDLVKGGGYAVSRSAYGETSMVTAAGLSPICSLNDSGT